MQWSVFASRGQVSTSQSWVLSVLQALMLLMKLTLSNGFFKLFYLFHFCLANMLPEQEREWESGEYEDVDKSDEIEDFNQGKEFQDISYSISITFSSSLNKIFRRFNKWWTVFSIFSLYRVCFSVILNDRCCFLVQDSDQNLKLRKRKT